MGTIGKRWILPEKEAFKTMGTRQKGEEKFHK